MLWMRHMAQGLVGCAGLRLYSTPSPSSNPLGRLYWASLEPRDLLGQGPSREVSTHRCGLLPLSGKYI